jgi:hypothetical protein
MLALDDELLKEYFAFEHNRVKDYDKTTIIKLFKYLQPFKMSVRQKEALGLSDEKIKSLRDIGLLKIYRFKNENDLIKNTKLKLMLTKDRADGTYPYPYINILDDEVDVSFTATYKSGENRDKAVEHIRALLLDAKEINIYDRYLSKVNYSNDSWDINKELLIKILPQKDMMITIYCEYDWDTNRKNNLILVYSDWTINKEDFDRNIHDRYIETDKVIILLSSGIINLSSTSKDFTYIVKIK